MDYCNLNYVLLFCKSSLEIFWHRDYQTKFAWLSQLDRRLIEDYQIHCTLEQVMPNYGEFI